MASLNFLVQKFNFVEIIIFDKFQFCNFGTKIQIDILDKKFGLAQCVVSK